MIPWTLPGSMEGRLACAALGLGFLTLLAGDAPRKSGPPADLRTLADVIEQERDHIGAQRLAGLIAARKPGYRLIDLRDSSAYSAGRIPGAERMDLPALASTDFPSADTLILYSAGGIHASQALCLLWMRGYTTVLTLRGGYSAWEDLLRTDSSRHRRRSSEAPVISPPPREREKPRDEC